MDVNKFIEHQSKELLKQMVDDASNFTDQVRFDLKVLINASQTVEELAKGMIIYFLSGAKKTIML